MKVTIQQIKKIFAQNGGAPSFLKSKFFKSRGFYPNGQVALEVIREGQPVAPFVAPIVGGKVMEREGSKLSVIELPTIAPQRVITAQDVLKGASVAGVEVIDGSSTPESRKVEIEARDFAFLDESITRNEELQCAEALFYGKVTLEGEGYTTKEIKFWDDNNKPYTALSGGALWTASATADPESDLEFAIGQVQERSGHVVTDIVMSPATWALARKSANLLKSLDTANVKIGEINSDSQDEKTGERFVGTLCGANVWTYNKKVTVQSSAGAKSSKALVPDGLVLFASDAAQTEMSYGTVAISKPGEDDFEMICAERVPNKFVKSGEARKYNEIKSAALANLSEVDAFYVLKVIA